MLDSESLAADQDRRRISHHGVERLEYGSQVPREARSISCDTEMSLFRLLLPPGVGYEFQNMLDHLERRAELPRYLRFRRFLQESGEGADETGGRERVVELVFGVLVHERT